MSDYPRLERTQTERPKTGIIHLGPGAFFRAFNAIFTAETMQQSGGDWGIQAVSLRSPGVRDKLIEQGYAYTSVSLTPEGTKHSVIEVINDILVAPEKPEAVLAAMAASEVSIVSLTITEKGYCHNPATGSLRLDDEDIQHDLQHPESPITALGFLVHALARRRTSGLPPFTVLSCDNLPNNGALTRNVVLEFARALDSELAIWIESNCCFPSTMVDRITPATTETDIEQLASSQGYLDKGCVVHEPFRQWVIEDHFVDGKRPDWNLAGAQFVQNVEAFEHMKLRCLNGTHSSLAYLGYLAGFETIADTVNEPVFVQLLNKLWQNEIIPTVPKPEGEDLQAYCAALLERYQNPNIRHRTWQIAMDGSQKLPQRILGTLQENLIANRDISGLTLAVAAWMYYVGGVDENGEAIDVRDPLTDILRKASDSSEKPLEKVAALLAIDDVFPTELANNSRFRDSLGETYSNLCNLGAVKMISEVLS